MSRRSLIISLFALLAEFSLIVTARWFWVRVFVWASVFVLFAIELWMILYFSR